MSVQYLPHVMIYALIPLEVLCAHVGMDMSWIVTEDLVMVSYQFYLIPSA